MLSEDVTQWSLISPESEELKRRRPAGGWRSFIDITGEKRNFHIKVRWRHGFLITGQVQNKTFDLLAVFLWVLVLLWDLVYSNSVLQLQTWTEEVWRRLFVVLCSVFVSFGARTDESSADWSLPWGPGSVLRWADMRLCRPSLQRVCFRSKRDKNK